MGFDCALTLRSAILWLLNGAYLPRPGLPIYWKLPWDRVEGDFFDWPDGEITRVWPSIPVFLFKLA